MNIEEKVWLLVGKKRTWKDLTGRLKLRFSTEIGRFHWNQGEEVAHFAWFGEPCGGDRSDRRKPLATGLWFSLGTPASSTNKTDCHDITEIVLKEALNTMTLTLYYHFCYLFKYRIIEFIYIILSFVVCCLPYCLMLWYIFFSSFCSFVISINFKMNYCCSFQGGKVQWRNCYLSFTNKHPAQFHR